MSRVLAAPRRARVSRRELSNFAYGLLFALPGLIGLLTFVAYPVFASLYYSFTSYSIIGRYRWVGLGNYVNLLTLDDEFWNVLGNTTYFVALSVPLHLVVALLLALLLNSRVPGLSVYRTLFYLPSVVPAVATAMLWLWMYHPTNGILNSLLDVFGIVGPNWLGDRAWAKPALVLMSVWGGGGLMLILLAGLQDVPQELYDAAEVDGAGWWPRFWNVTIPFLSPHLFFGLVTGLIGGFQYFTQVYIMTSGGPARSTAVYSFYLWENAFQFLKMGYASAMAWILLMIVAACTALVFITASRRVYYGGR
ncbi:MAG: sugar ABC transporter permease [Chloroflexi bacterium]|nr:sugar ABC transporter permease [Chloroflexota bacterium]